MRTVKRDKHVKEVGWCRCSLDNASWSCRATVTAPAFVQALKMVSLSFARTRDKERKEVASTVEGFLSFLLPGGEGTCIQFLTKLLMVMSLLWWLVYGSVC